MKSRFHEIIVAVLFLVTATASVYGVTVIDPLLNRPDYLVQVAAHPVTLAWGALLWSINNVGIVFIAVFVFPLLRRINEAAAVGYLATRIIEGTIMMFGIAATLLLGPLSHAFVAAGSPASSWYQTLADSLKQAKFMGLTEVSLPLLGLGGCLFTVQLLRFRLIPLVLSLVGLVGYVLVFIGGIVAWFGWLDASPLGPGTFMAIPVALFEIVLLPFWLFFRGFKTPSASPHEVRS